MIAVIHAGGALQEQLDHVRVSSSGRHGQNAGPQPVPAINVGSVLQQDVSDARVTEPGTRHRWRRLDTSYRFKWILGFRLEPEPLINVVIKAFSVLCHEGEVGS